MSKVICCFASPSDEEPRPLFIGREDGTVEKYISIKDADLGQPSLVLRGHTRAVTGLYAPHAQEVYSSSLDGTIRRWNASTEEEGIVERTLRVTRFGAPLKCLANNGDRLYAGGEDGSLNVVDGERQSTWDGHSEAINCIAFYESGLVITGGSDHQIRVFNSSTGQCIRVLQGHQNQVKAVACVEAAENSEGEPVPLIFSFSRDGAMKFWNVPDPEEPAQDPLLGELASLRASVDDDQQKAAVSFQEPKAQEETEQTEEEFNPVVDVINNPEVSAKSAMKPKDRHKLVRRQFALGTVELPQVPHTVFYEPEEEEKSLMLVGTAGGYVLGIDAALFAKNVVHFVATNQLKVRKEMKSTRSTLRSSVAMINKNFTQVVRAEQKRHVRAAKTSLKEKKRAEKELKRLEREERLAAARAAREQRKEGDDDEEEEEEAPEEEGAEEEDEEEVGEEEEEEEGADPLKLLSDEQRAELEKFTKLQENEKNEKLQSIQQAVAQHLSAIEPLARSTYDRPREEFFRLKGTTYIQVGGEAVTALTDANGKIYCAQGNRVVKSAIALGVTKLQ
ncbi:WD domain, G-beta repeat, putative [Angomonas deanei]|uniref:WD domain, G-beta repeat, putative n=1 Tax=Angomonas deanei TaxID=59799 RepID=A0A7G2CSX5_9TRYP|nr:WD domain, G-beta repeat, putative [Angomonas deanei]